MPKINFGKSWKEGKAIYRYGYVNYRGNTYKRKQKKTSKGWIFVGAVLILTAAALWAPVGGFSWLFRLTHA